MRWMWAGVVSAGVAGAAQADVPRVAVDIAPLHSIVASVMGALGTPDLLVPPGASPHGYAMRPSEARALDRADVIVWVGPTLTPWLERPVKTLGAGALSMTVMDVPGTFELALREGENFEAHDHDHGHADHHDDDHEEGHDDHHDDDHHDDDHHDDDHEDGHDDHKDEHDHGDDHDDHDHEDAHAKAGGTDHDHGDDHADEHEDEHEDEHAHDDHQDEHDHADEHDHEDGHDDAQDHADHGDETDPHGWLDPRNASLWAGAIATALSDHDPENAGTYAQNAQAFQQQMANLEAELNAKLSPVRGRPFVVFHDAYHYFEHRFEIEAIGSVSDSDATAPSAARVSGLQAKITDLGAVCALAEPQYNPGLLNAIGAATLGVIDPLGAALEPGPALYPDVLRGIAGSLVECLG